TATDNCAGSVTIVSTPASGTAFPIGTTTVTSTATDACGNSSSCTFTVTVADAQLPVITAHPQNRTVCAGTNATFSVTAITSPSANGPLAYQWQQWNGSAWVNISGATASSFTVSNATVAMNTNTFRVVVTGLCSVVISNAATLYVNPAPTVVITATPPPSILPNQTTTLNATTFPPGSGTFSWFFNGSVIPGATTSSLGPLNINQLGTYRVVYTDGNGCVGTSANFDVTGALSNQIWVYPNPNFGQFQVRFYNLVNEPATVNVFNAAGQKVYQRSLITGITTYTQIDIDLGLKANGMYIVQIVNGSGKQLAAKQIIVQN
ncbi:MAG TPA: T9SS type A sorting domain-containing protein, partial [Chitinophagaceae bacterium]|nr:T9SS type A sorting domain-containing protein [Chitinophagaceae bacterium]